MGSTMRCSKNHIQHLSCGDNAYLFAALLLEMADYLAYGMTAFRIGKHIPIPFQSRHSAIYFGIFSTSTTRPLMTKLSSGVRKIG